MRNSRILDLIFAGGFLAGAIASSAGTLIDVAFTGVSVTTKTGFAATGLTTNDFWNTYVVDSGALSNLEFVDGTASGAGMTVANAGGVYGNGASDPMYGVYLFSSPPFGNSILTITNLSAGLYDFYLYGHGNQDNQSGIFQLTVGLENYGTEATTNGSGWLSPVWQEGVQYVEFTNVIVLAGQTITITVEQGASGYDVLSGLQMDAVPLPSSPFISIQPTNEEVMQGSTATFTVLAGGATPLAYQWLFNDVNISAATNSGYTVNYPQQTNAGNYTVIVTNTFGTVTSLVAALTVGVPFIDVAFTDDLITDKTGFAATGETTHDFWNTCKLTGGEPYSSAFGLPDLETVDGAASGAGLAVTDPETFFDAYSNGASDPMYGVYIYPLPSFDNITVTVTNLIAGAYDFYLYGHGNEDNQDSVYQLTVGARNYGTEATTNGSGWLSPVWEEGVQYVEFTNVGVCAGETITILVEPGVGDVSAISGLQIVPVSQPFSSPFILTQPVDQTSVQGSTVDLDVVAGGAPPLAYQWQFNSINISDATNSSYSVSNLQPGNAGLYGVVVTNAYGSLTSLVAALNVIEKTTNVISVAFTTSTVTGKSGFAATGVTANDFWNTCAVNAGASPNLEFMDDTASGAGLTVTDPERNFGADGNGASDPMYGVYVYPNDLASDGGNITVTITNLAAGTYDFYLYGHGNEDNQNSVFQLIVGSQSYGSEATTNGFGWLSPVWQEGVQYVEFTNVVVSAGQAAAITVEPGVGGYAVLSGLQMATAGPLPDNPFVVTQPTNQAVAFGSNATFSVLTGGLAPLAYQWLLNNGDISGATNSSYSVTNAQATNGGSYSVIVTNSYGSITSLVAVLTVGPAVAVTIDVAFTDALITDKTGFAATGATANDFWNTANGQSLPNLEFVDGTPSGAGLTIVYVEGAYGNGAYDPMYGTYLFNQFGSMTVTINNLMEGAYDIYCYGHGNGDSQNGVFQVAAGSEDYGTETTTNGPGWLSPVWQEGVQYVEFTNVSVSVGQTITITVEPGAGGYAVLSGLQMAPGSPSSSSPFLVSQPVNQAVAPGATATFSVVAGGAAPLAYQWLVNGANISAATNSTYIVTNAQHPNVGNYSVIVTNVYGSTTSAVAALNVIAPVTKVIDVDFTSASITSKTGFAATGVTTNDFWNTYTYNSGALPILNLKFMDGTASGADVAVANVEGVYGNDASDPMYASYLYNQFGNMAVTITNLIGGAYDFYIYGHGDGDTEYSVFQLTVGWQGYGSEATISGPGWLSSVWQEGVQYVEFTNVNVPAGQTITITVESGESTGGSIFAVLAGLQMASSPSPFIVIQPANQQVAQGASATFSVVAGGAAPLAYQWLFNNANISEATNSSYIVTNAQLASAGNYSVIVTNPYGSMTSLPAVLEVGVVINGGFEVPPITNGTGLVNPGDLWLTGWTIGGPGNGLFVITGSGAGLSPVDGQRWAGFDAQLAPPGGSLSQTFSTVVGNTYLLTYFVAPCWQSGLLKGLQATVLAADGSLLASNEIAWVGLYGNTWSPVRMTFSALTTNTALIFTDISAPYWGLSVGLDAVSVVALPTNSPPLIINAPNQSVSANQWVIVTNYGYSADGPISFTLASDAPAGASITPDGIFYWAPTCEQGSTTNLITVWATDSSSPPLSNSMTFSVIVGECVEVRVGSNVVQAGQSTCVPVSLLSTVALTNLSFTLAYPGGFLTNWNVMPSNSVIASATADTVDPSHAQFNFGVQTGQVLQGASVLGLICLDTLPGASAFVPLVVTNMGAVASNNSPATNFIAQTGRLVVIGPQSLLEASPGTNSSRTLTLYGNPGMSYDLLSTTNLTDRSSWSTVGSVTLTDLFEVINLGGATNQMQFFKAIQP